MVTASGSASEAKHSTKFGRGADAFASKDQLHADLDVTRADLGRADAAERTGRKVGGRIAEHHSVERVLHFDSSLVCEPLAEADAFDEREGFIETSRAANLPLVPRIFSNCPSRENFTTRELP